MCCGTCGCACAYVKMCMFVFWQMCMSKGIRSQASPGGTQGACHFKGPWGPLCQPTRQGGNPVYVAGPHLAEPVANTTAWCLHRLSPPMQV